jgi:hypothetical protein
MKIFVIASTLALVLLYPQLVAAREPIAHRPVGNTRVVLGQTWIKNAARKGLAGADVAFLRSPAGVAYQEKLQAVDVQINAVYEQFLNIYYVDPGTEEGKAIRAEKRKLLVPLLAKQKQINKDYEEQKYNSPDYRATLQEQLERWERHEQSIIKGRRKAAAAEQEAEEPEDVE